MTFELEVPVLTWRLVAKVRPPSLLTATKYCVKTLNWALRVSYQPTPMSPLVGSSARLGKNWLDPGGSLLTWIGALQVAPPSSEKRRKMLVSTVLGAATVVESV
jgi:hypothetical protein